MKKLNGDQGVSTHLLAVVFVAAIYAYIFIKVVFL